MSFLPDRVVVFGIFCCMFLLEHEVQSKRKPSSTTSTLQISTSKDAVRLVHCGSPCCGRLQIRSHDSWRYVCFSGLTEQTASVSCRELECGSFAVGSYGSPIGFAEKYSWSAVHNCSGQEQRLADCPSTPLDSESECRPSTLRCSDQPREPEVSVYSTSDVTIGADSYSSVFARHPFVIECRVDNAPFPVQTFSLQVDPGDGNVSEWVQPAVDDAAHFFVPIQPPLSGDGISFNCKYNFQFKPEVFSRPEESGVRFREPLYARLVGGESRCLGDLELEYEEEWRGVSQRLWGLKEAAVVCRQLGCGPAIGTNRSSGAPRPVWRFYSDCSGSEAALLTCGSVRGGQALSTVNVLCSDIMPAPTVRVETVKNSTREGAIVVYSRYSFSVNCSMLPLFPGGHFSLSFTGLQRSLTLDRTAVNHSAVFTFDVAEREHSGIYSCVYHNIVSGQKVSSPSQEVAVIVEDADDVLLDDGAARKNNGPVCSGTLMLKDGSQTLMVSAETAHWDMRHAAIVCRQLGCGSALSTSTFAVPKVTPMWRFYTDCDGSEAVLLQCGHVARWFSSKAIRVVCEGGRTDG